MEEVVCMCCGFMAGNFRRLSKHIRDQHGMNSETYWNLTNSRPKCHCGKETKFVNLSLGYKATCSHSCGAKVFRSNLSKDIEKSLAFRSKVATNMQNIWRERMVSGEAQEILERSANSNRKNIAELSDAERLKKYTHNPRGNLKSLKSYWKSASDADIANIRKKASRTIAEMTDCAWKESLQRKVRSWIEGGGYESLNRVFGIASG